MLHALGIVMAGVAGAAAAQLDVGEADTTLAMADGNHPEGIAVDQDGVIYVGNRYINDQGLQAAEIFTIDTDGTVALYAELPASFPAASGLLGLGVDPGGDVFAANVTFDPSTHGIYRISHGGAEVERLAGSQAMVFPNAITFDGAGYLYATDSLAGSVWRFSIDDADAGAPWVQHPLLAPLPDDPLGVPLPGANGIAFYPPNHLYIANTEKGLLAHVEINGDGSAGTPELVAFDFFLLTIDGIAVDVSGDVYGVVPGFAFLGTSPIINIDPGTGDVTPVVTDGAEAAKFDVPLSLAFGRTSSDRKTVYTTNGDLPIIPGGPGPGVVQVGIGKPGFNVK